MKSKEELDHEKLEAEQNRKIAEAQHSVEVDFFNRANEFTVASGNHAVRAFLLINGGAAVALLAFIGSLVGSDSSPVMEKLPELTAPLMWFVWGVAFASGTYGAAFFANRSMVESSSAKAHSYKHPFVHETKASTNWSRAAIGLQVLAVAMALVSLFSFIGGMFEIREAISNLPLPNQ